MFREVACSHEKKWSTGFYGKYSYCKVPLNWPRQSTLQQRLDATKLKKPHDIGTSQNTQAIEVKAHDALKIAHQYSASVAFAGQICQREDLQPLARHIKPVMYDLGKKRTAWYVSWEFHRQQGFPKIYKNSQWSFYKPVK